MVFQSFAIVSSLIRLFAGGDIRHVCCNYMVIREFVTFTQSPHDFALAGRDHPQVEIAGTQEIDHFK